MVRIHMFRRSSAWPIVFMLGVVWLAIPSQFVLAEPRPGAFSEVRRLTAQSDRREHPRIEGDRIVWEDGRHQDSLNPENTEIYLYNLVTSTELRVPSTTTGQYNNKYQALPDVGGGYIVWQDGRNVDYNAEVTFYDTDIWRYKISTANVAKLTTDPQAQSQPSLSGPVACWLDEREDADAIELKFVVTRNLDTNQETAHPLPEDVFTSNVACDGNALFWFDDRNSGVSNPVQDLWMFQGGIEQHLVSIPDNANPDDVTTGDGNVLWTDRRSWATTGADLYAWSAANGVHALVQDPLHQIHPRISGPLYLYASCQEFGLFSFFGAIGGFSGCDLWLGNLTTGKRVSLVLGGTVTGYDIEADHVVWTECTDPDLMLCDVYYGVLNPIVNHAPIAQAGADQQALLGTPAILNGCGSTDPDEDALTYAWHMGTASGSVVGTTCSITRPSPASPATETYVLVVSDGELTSQDTVEVAWQYPVDLAVMSLTYAPAQPKVNEQITYTATVKNLGSYAAPATYLRFEFMCTGIPLLNWAQAVVPVLAAGQQATVSTYGSCMEPGTYGVFARTDATGLLIDPVAANNYASATVTISPLPAYPDLTVTSLTTLPAPPYAGQPFQVSAVVKNVGTALAAEGFSGGFARWTVGPHVLDVFLPPLAPGNTATLTYTVPAAEVHTGASWALALTVDPGNHIQELNEANNTATTTVTVASCYILSAAFGRPDHPVIQSLWQAHHHLVGSQWNAPWHQAYMRWYDCVGPKIAAWLSDRPWMKGAIRTAAIGAAYLTQALGFR